MPFEISDLGEWDGRIGRRTYFLAGFFGCAVKFNLDRLIAIYFFHRSINSVDYWRPLGAAASLKNLTLADLEWLGVLVVTALPFIYVGLTMTVRRLRDLDYPLCLTALFFVPAVNLLFFFVLCVLPSASGNTSHDAFSRERALAFGALMPRSKLGSATVATIVTGSLGLFAVVGLGTVAGSYGWSLFPSIPFCMGLFATLLYGAREPRTSRESNAVALLSVTIAGVALLAVAVEGVICLAMAAPIAYAAAALGGMIGHSVVVLGTHRSTVSLDGAVGANVRRHRTRSAPRGADVSSAIFDRNRRTAIRGLAKSCRLLGNFSATRNDFSRWRSLSDSCRDYWARRRRRPPLRVFHGTFH